jgi:hypothetical protein
MKSNPTLGLQPKHLKWIQLAADSINRLVEDVLALEKTESGQLTANLKLLKVLICVGI